MRSSSASLFAQRYPPITDSKSPSGTCLVSVSCSIQSSVVGSVAPEHAQSLVGDLLRTCIYIGRRAEIIRLDVEVVNHWNSRRCKNMRSYHMGRGTLNPYIETPNPMSIKLDKLCIAPASSVTIPTLQSQICCKQILPFHSSVSRPNRSINVSTYSQIPTVASSRCSAKQIQRWRPFLGLCQNMQKRL